MVAIYTGQEVIPGQPDYQIPLTVEEVNIVTQQGLGPSPEESQIIYDEAVRLRAEDAERQRLADMERQARQAGEEFYAEGGAGYGTTPGGPDYVYMPSDAPPFAGMLYTGLDPYYGEGGLLAPVTDFVKGDRTGSDKLLLYGAIAIGALALLKK